MVQFIKLVSSAAIVLASLDVQAQPQPDASAPAAANPAPAATDSQAANRQLAKDVRHALRQAKHQGQRFSNITVRASKGVVSLTGSVPEASQIDLAIATAKGLPGVQSVNSRLAVRNEIVEHGSQ